MKKQSGFTLIELMIVVAIIAIIAAIAIPNLLSARLNANETSAISTLRNISSSQSQFQASSKADIDNDGTGEFGFFRELSGAFGIRTQTGTGPTVADGSAVTATTLNPPVLSGAFRTMSAAGTVSRSGYLFNLYLPDANGDGQTETTGPGAFTGPIEADLSETTYCGYAWPANYGNSGNRSFFVNQTGDITSTDFNGYTGPGAGPANGAAGPAAAFVAGGPVDSITGLVAVGAAGRDNLATSQLWRQVN